jgi:hypothetical protein
MRAAAWKFTGTRRRWTFLLPVLTRLLEDYPNLYVDLSWSVLEPYLLDSEGVPRQAWLQLVERFPERFMLGSDLVGRFDSLGEQLHGFKPFSMPCRRRSRTRWRGTISLPCYPRWQSRTSSVLISRFCLTQISNRPIPSLSDGTIPLGGILK